MTDKKFGNGKNYARKKLYKMVTYSLCWEGLVNSLYIAHVPKRTISNEQQSTLLFRFVFPYHQIINRLVRLSTINPNYYYFYREVQLTLPCALCWKYQLINV